MTALPQVKYRVDFWRSTKFVDITGDISPHLLSVTYRGRLQGASDDIEMVFEDSHDFFKSEWAPRKGDTVKLSFEYNGFKLNCGTFELDSDKDQSDESGDTYTIKGLATGVTQAVRQKNSAYYEKTTLVKLAQEAADEHGFKILGDPPTFDIFSVGRRHETRLEFLSRVALEYDYTFKVSGNTLVFAHLETLDAANAVVKLTKKDIFPRETWEESPDSHSGGEIKSVNSETGEVYTSLEEGEGINASGLRVHGTTKTQDQADRKIRAAINQKKRKGLQGKWTIPAGDCRIDTGLPVEMAEYGHRDGTWQVAEVEHKADRDGGYSTMMDVYRVKAA